MSLAFQSQCLKNYFFCLPSSLDILHGTRAFLYPFLPLLAFYLFTLAANWNLTKSLMYFYHYRVL